MIRKPEITQMDLKVFYEIHRYRGVTRDYISSLKLFSSPAYLTQRLFRLVNREYINSIPIKNQRWKWGRLLQLRSKGVETLGENLGWDDLRIDLEQRRWKNWRGDNNETIHNRLYIFEAGRQAEKAGWNFIGKFDLLGWQKQVADNSRIGGALQRSDQTYALFVIDGRGGKMPITRAKDESRRIRDRVTGVIVLCRDEWSKEAWGLPTFWEYVVSYDLGIAILSMGDAWEEQMRKHGNNEWKR